MLSKAEHEEFTAVANHMGMPEDLRIRIRTCIMAGNFNAKELQKKMQNVPNKTNKAFDALCALAVSHIKSQRNRDLTKAAGSRSIDFGWSEQQNPAPQGGGKGGKGGKDGSSPAYHAKGGDGKGGDGKGGKGYEGKGGDGRGGGKGGKGKGWAGGRGGNSYYQW